MSDLELLVALKEIRQLEARRDRYADARDWDAYESLHASDHVSHNDGLEPWTSSKQMIDNVSRILNDMITMHLLLRSRDHLRYVHQGLRDMGHDWRCDLESR